MSKVNTGQAPSTLIPKYIGSDFDKVIAVADNIEQVVIVGDNIEDVGTVADNINYVKEVAEDLHGMPVTMYTGENPPVLNPMPEGVMWYCTTDGRTYVWYTDADSGQWVESAPQSAMKDEATNIFFHSVPSNVNPAYRSATLFSTSAPEAEISVAHNTLNTPVVQAQFIREEALWVDVSVIGAQGIVTLMGYSSGSSQLKAEIITWKNGAEGTSLGASHWVTLPSQPSVVSLPVTLANIDVLDAGDSYVVKLTSQMNAGGSAVSTILVDGNTSSRFGIIFNTNLIGLNDGIRDGVITSAPTENAVYDALQLKADKTEVSDALQLKVGKSQLVQSGELLPVAGWADVPAYSDSELGGLNGPLNAQAKALTARSELLLTDVREALRRSYAEAGYNLVAGSFEVGGTLVNSNDVLLHEASGKAFTGPAGAVPEGTDPASGGFVDRSDTTLRQELRNSNDYVIADWFELETDTDGASCVNRALEYVSAKGGGIVQLLAREYSVDTQILIPEKCHLRGAGIDVSILSASMNLAKELNVVTTKNNPMYTFKCTSLTGPGSAYTYTNDVHVSDLTVLGNHVTRAPDATALAHVKQGCGIRFTSVIGGSIKRVRVHQPVVHGISVDASAYFDDGDYTHNIAGGSRDVLVEDCIASNALIDDCITTHNSKDIVFNRCVAQNDGTDPNMQWGNNQHGIEVDEGSEDVTVLDCKATNLICGFQAKGHDTTYAARRVKFVRCHAKNCVTSFMTDHFDTMSNIGGGGEVLFIDCTSETPLNDKYQISNPTYRPRHMWLRSYDGITIRGLTLKGPGGIIQLERGVRNVGVSAVKHTGGYSGFDAGTTGAGLFLIVSNSTKGGIWIDGVTCRDAMSIPVVRSGDSTIRRISLSNISAPMSVVDMPLIMINSQSLPTINRCYVAGSSTVVVNMPNLGAVSIRSDVVFSLNNGFADIIGGINPSGGTSLFPAVVGWVYKSWNSGDMWIAKGSGGMQTIGSWKLVTTAS